MLPSSYTLRKGSTVILQSKPDPIIEVNGWTAVLGIHKYIAHEHCKAGDRIVWNENEKEPWVVAEPRLCGTCGSRIPKMDFMKLLMFLKSAQ